MLPIEKLDRDILDIDADPALSAEEKQRDIAALVAKRRAGAFTTGASIHYYTGDVKGGSGPLEKLAGIRVAIAKRVTKDGRPDGIGGSAGGLAKRLSSTKLDPALANEARIIKTFGSNVISPALLKQHAPCDPALKQALLDVFDDVIETQGGVLAVTRDMAVILDKNIRREAREELGERAYALMRPVLDSMPFRVALSGITDDRYVCTPAWWRSSFEKDGILAYPCTATTVFMKIDGSVFDTLLSLTAQVDGGDGEITGLTAIPLTELLTRLSGAGHGNPGHDPERHYRHGHEGLVPWKIAAELLDNDPARFEALVRAIAPLYPQGNRLDFQKIAQQVKLTLSDLDRQFGFQPGFFSSLGKGPSAQLPKNLIL